MMIICYRRHVTYLLFGLPLVAYLILVLCLLTRVCPRSGLGTPSTASDFRENYQALAKLLRDHVSREEYSPNKEIFNTDLRKLLDLKKQGRTSEHTNQQDLDKFLDQFVQKLRVQDSVFPLEDTPPEAFKDLNVHTWHVRDSKLDFDSLTRFQDTSENNLGHSKTQYPTYIHNCSTISTMRIKSPLGHGVSKQAFVADYQGTQVVIKMVTRHVTEVKKCLKRLRQVKTIMSKHTENANSVENDLQHNTGSFISPIRDSTFEHNFNGTPQASVKKNSIFRENGELGGESIEHRQVELTPAERQSCYIPSTARVMKEILLSQQLRHPNLATMLGYCVRSEESETTDISEHGVISVFELGSRFVLDSLQILPWPTRLRHATEMASLLHYLEFSPIGSLVVPDFKEGHVIMVNDSLKLIDLDDVNNLEPECGPKRSIRDDNCPYGIRCSRALCEGFNAKENLKNMNRLVFKRLLFPTTFPGHVIPEVGQLNADMDTLKVTAGQVLDRLRRIKKLAKMQNET